MYAYVFHFLLYLSLEAIITSIATSVGCLILLVLIGIGIWYFGFRRRANRNRIRDQSSPEEQQL